MSKSLHHSKAKALKELGVIPASYDLRKPLSKWQKENINRKYTAYGAYIENKKLFSAPLVKSKMAKRLRISGYLVTPRGRAIIPKGANDIVRINSHGEIEKLREGEISYTLLRQKRSDDFMDTLRGMLSKKLEKNEMITVQIGHNNPFSRVFNNFAELYHYLENDFEPHDDGDAPELIWPIMSLVRITGAARKQTTVKSARESTKGTPVKIRRKSRK